MAINSLHPSKVLFIIYFLFILQFSILNFNLGVSYDIMVSVDQSYYP